MNRFQFRLENVLRVRGAEEMKIKREFGIALQNVRNAEERCRAVETEIRELERLAEGKETGHLAVADIQVRHRYARHLEQVKEAREKELEQARKVMDIKRSDLVEATRRKKTLERLREHALGEYEKAVVKEEQNSLDELTAIKFKPENRK
ncbi:MAG: flagellar export protein FliJ [Candidatus Latescibacterota bacterium]